MKPEYIAPPAFTIESLENLKKQPRGYQAASCDARIRFLEAESKRRYVELGIIVLFVEEHELWKEMCNADGVVFHSVEHWITEACPASRGHAFSAKAAVKVFRENNLPIEEVQKIPHKNIKHLKGLSTAVMRDPEILTNAETLSELDFVQTVRKKYPDQLLEARVPLRLNPTCSQRAIYDKVFQKASEVYETTDREELLEYIMQDWNDGIEEEKPKAMEARA